MAWKKTYVAWGYDAKDQEYTLRSQYTDDDNQILAQIEFYHRSPGRIDISVLWHRSLSHDKQVEIWEFLEGLELGDYRANDEHLDPGPVIWPKNPLQQNQFLAIIFILGKFELQTQQDICAEFGLSLDDIEKAIPGGLANLVNEIFKVDDSELVDEILRIYDSNAVLVGNFSSGESFFSRRAPNSLSLPNSISPLSLPSAVSKEQRKEEKLPSSQSALDSSEPTRFQL